jgi:hypothetical protein
VSVLTAEETEAKSAALLATQLSAVANAPAAALNSVVQVQPYQFNPEQYQDYRMENSGWWSLEAHRMPLYFIPESVRVRLARTLLKRLLR